MKKLLGLFLVSVLIVSGCSGSDKNKKDENTVTCTLQQGENKIEYELGYDAKELVKTIKGTVLVASDEEVNDEQMEMIESVYSSMFDEIEGIDYELNLNKSNKKEVTIIIDIDLEKYDAEEDALGMFANITDKEDITKTKVSDITKSFEASGGECGKIK